MPTADFVGKVVACKELNLADSTLGTGLTKLPALGPSGALMVSGTNLWFRKGSLGVVADWRMVKLDV